MIDPLERWREYRREARLCRAAHVRRHALHGGPGRARGRRRGDRRRAHRRSRLRPARRALRPRARSARRAARPGRTWRRASTRFAELRVVDFGDAAVLPADPVRTHAAIEALVGAGARRGRDADRARRRPLDRRAGHPRLRRAARAGRADPLRHPHRHRRGGVRRRALARHDHVPPGRAGARGPAPLRPDRAARLLAGREEFGWQAERGITSFFMHDIRDLGIREVVDASRSRSGRGPPT